MMINAVGFDFFVIVSTLLLLTTISIVFKLWNWNHVVVIEDDDDDAATVAGYEDLHSDHPQVVIDPGRAFCQRIKFVMRMKRRMRDFKSRKDKTANTITEQKNK